MALYEVLFHFKTGISKSRYFKGGIFDLLVQRFSNFPQIQYGTISQEDKTIKIHVFDIVEPILN